ncbi:Spore germination protein YndE [Paenibacillus allorhizoplanae]|uniref:Spore germination protein YndE n=1 Tax=Paenibacillus allorhizoplanae TaxID=2905648 RepID=A0ABM9BX25_9BACL|nr:endospore germination permease [Paenibacillus allorhizoplanae]CAH1195217.1 Spore germination protein YndE [Paenibacillus allorhizoplanae]
MHTFDNATISVRQFTILIILGVIGDSILIMPTILAASAKQDAWLSMLLAIFLGFIAAGLFAGIANKLRRRRLFNLLRLQLGVWIGSFFIVLFLFEFYMCSLTLLSEMSQFMTTQLMPETPVNAINAVFLLVIIIAYRYGVEAFARMGELLFSVFMLLFLILVVLLLPQVDFANLEPIAIEGIGPIWRGSLMAFSTAFAEMVMFLMLVSNVTGHASLTKPIVIGFAIGGAILFVTVVLCLLVLGTHLMETKYYPTFVLAQKITIGHFLERLEAVMAFLWFISVFYKTLLLFFALISGLAQLFQLKESHMLTIPIGMLILVGTISGTPNITVYNDILQRYYGRFDIVFCIFIPALLLILFYIHDLRDKRKKGTQNDSELLPES